MCISFFRPGASARLHQRSRTSANIVHPYTRWTSEHSTRSVRECPHVYETTGQQHCVLIIPNLTCARLPQVQNNLAY